LALIVRIRCPGTPDRTLHATTQRCPAGLARGHRAVRLPPSGPDTLRAKATGAAAHLASV